MLRVSLGAGQAPPGVPGGAGARSLGVALRHALFLGLSALVACGEDPSPQSSFTPLAGDSGGGDTDPDTGGDTGTDPGPSAALEDLGSPADLACALSFRVEHDAWALPGRATLTPQGGAARELPVHWEGDQGRVVGLLADTTYTLSLTLLGDQGEPAPPTLEAAATTGSLPGDLPPLGVTTHDTALASGGITVFPVARWNPFADAGWGYLIAVDPAGEVVWYWDAGALTLAFHVEPDADGVPWVYTSDFVGAALAVSPFTGEVRRLDAATAGIDTVHHEVRPMPGGGLAVMSTELRQIGGFDGGTLNIVGDLLVELGWDGTVTRSAAILDHVDPTEIFTADMHAPFWEAGPYAGVSAPKDWSHGNAMELDTTHDQWIASFRNIDWIMAFDRSTGGVNWAFGPGGDFTLAPGGRWSSRQHAPELTAEGTLLVYDNGLDRADAAPGEVPFSRVVEYALDTDTLVATELWSWGGEDPYLCPIVGDVDRLAPDRHLITDGALVGGLVDLGGGLTVNHMTGRVREIVGTESPTVVWELVIGPPGDTDRDGATVYRAERIGALGPPL